MPKGVINESEISWCVDVGGRDCPVGPRHDVDAAAGCTLDEIPYGAVTVAEAQALIDTNPELVIVDVRTPEEFADGHIEGAILLPVSELADRLDELAPEDELLIYCRTKNSSTTAMTILTANGFTQQFHMHEGITGWVAAGYPTVST